MRSWPAPPACGLDLRDLAGLAAEMPQRPSPSLGDSGDDNPGLD